MRYGETLTVTLHFWCRTLDGDADGELVGREPQACSAASLAKRAASGIKDARIGRLASGAKSDRPYRGELG